MLATRVGRQFKVVDFTMLKLQSARAQEKGSVLFLAQVFYWFRLKRTVTKVPLTKEVRGGSFTCLSNIVLHAVHGASCSLCPDQANPT